MRITYVTRSFLDYRIPVLEALNRKLTGGLRIIYSADYVPKRVHDRAKQSLRENAIGMRGEKRLGPNEFPDFANSAFRIVYQPGLLRAIKKTRPDVIVSDGFFQWAFFALLYKWLYRCPLVLCYERTFHTERRAHWYRTAYRKLVIRFVDAMACNGKLSLEYTNWLGIPESRITTGHMAADTENLAQSVASLSNSDRQLLRRTWGNPEVIFLAVGKLNKRKGIRELLLGWSLLEKSLPGAWALVLIGDGPDKEKLQQLAKDLGLEKVIFQGPVDYNEIASYYAAADVFVMPTLEDNWSLVVPEAMACGMPVLCSEYNGCYPELISVGENGWIFNPLDQQDTFNALRKCVVNRERLNEMGRKSKDIAALYSPDHAAEAILNACKIAVQRKSR